ncbi:hypothetical protein N7455_001764 [Penicillium solitum]|uniref:uncharacterized protein n=1 Tax=Penicillium solitum TaxID=60172 RepID=UPI0032C4575E|nr:hypothetical protein N7536_005742 [Penicillium majusculum]KAJ5878299.1 hypothetical protein N7455_001764 [Penicillium solitum]KAJ5957295.1 hypothetical protein N7501_011574 [Penicillium viridicatum]
MSGVAIATVQHTCWESYRWIGDKTMVALQHVPIASCTSTSPPPHYKQRSILSHYDYIFSYHRWLITCLQKLPSVPSAAYSKQQPENTRNWIQYHVNMV